MNFSRKVTILFSQINKTYSIMALKINKDTKFAKVGMYRYWGEKTFTTEADELSGFEQDEHLLEIDIPEGIEKIGECCFKDCKSLETVRIPASVKTIGRNAFIGCIELRNVVIEKSVAEIDVWFDERKVSKITLTPPFNDLVNMLLKGYEMEMKDLSFEF